ncbi:transcriptional regulator, TetR family [Prosthecobacter debontii]|uniref:Transcriptional regulator, TetR family n=1 Tax=Prosthecobacter debontii TaxID=48467 RepID=A0A1T4XK41_9BACT|nr:TetR/AcrR family transcriptional regulator [Prosthecobacter debontii]SKA89846.1 transcriptional regulator, TetR family [Prosthecobacter debontii]
MKTPRSAQPRTSPRRSTKLKPRERLVTVASKLFYQHGLRATGIDWIIADAEVAKMSFYRHFPSKSHLIAEYLRLQHERWMKRLTMRMSLRQEQTAGAGGIEQLAEVLTAWFEEPDFRGCPFIKAQAEASAEDERVREMIRLHQRELESYLTDLLIQMGYASPRSTAISVLVILQGSIVQAQISGDALSAGEACGAVLRRLSRMARRIEEGEDDVAEHQLLLAL